LSSKQAQAKPVDRKPKATYRALQAASRPVLCATSLPQTIFAPGTRLEFPIVGINETRRPVKLEVKWRWLNADASIVIGIDKQVNDIYLWSRPTAGAMIAVPFGHRGNVMREGTLSGSVAAEAAATLATLTLDLSDQEFAGATLELEWGDGQTNWYHALGAHDGWFCGPGAYVVSPSAKYRLGTKA
jgi:hypothetical protein